MDQFIIQVGEDFVNTNGGHDFKLGDAADATVFGAEGEATRYIRRNGLGEKGATVVSRAKVLAKQTIG